MNIGIWIDKEKAHIIRIEGEKESFETVYSDLEFFKPKGGSRTRSAKWGPQDVVQDSKFLEREKHQLKAYFKSLAELLVKADALALFGPADTKDKFARELGQNYKELAARLKTVEKADSMTQNQTIALVRDYFK